ncbi:hypothetical protein, partial [Peribacillus acanthi]|uniref:hypothetical protein n=1 Tax=Peribacillus acanthi TaxID=2171554 RepID=UPI00196A2150
FKISYFSSLENLLLAIIKTPPKENRFFYFICLPLGEHINFLIADAFYNLAKRWGIGLLILIKKIFTKKLAIKVYLCNK